MKKPNSANYSARVFKKSIYGLNMFRDFVNLPFLELLNITKNCPKAAHQYILMYLNKNTHNCLCVLKKDIKYEYLIDENKFSHALLSLVSEGVLNVNETPEKFYIDFIHWSETDEMDDIVC